MSDQFREVTKVGYGSRILNSIKGIVVGGVMFLVSFGVLYWNEGRVDLSTVAKTATEINATQINNDAGVQGKLVSVTGEVTVSDKIGDNMFLQPDTYLAVTRTVETYAWTEQEDSKTSNNTGGSETTETTYTYTKEWTSSPAASSSFKHPEGHENVMPTIEGTNTFASTATVGEYSFNPATIALPSATPVTLTADNFVTAQVAGQTATLATGNYVYIPHVEGGVYTTPAVGDMRISYTAVRPGFSGTIFGKLSGTNIASYTNDNGDTLYRLFTGDRTSAIASLHTEYTTMTWVLRLVGFLLMWFGLAAVFGPISVILDFLPIFGSISRSVIGMITFVVALVLSVTTIIISMILHNIVALIITALLMMGLVIGGFMLVKNMRAKKVVAKA